MELLLDENLSSRLVPFLQHDFPETSQVVFKTYITRSEITCAEGNVALKDSLCASRSANCANSGCKSRYASSANRSDT